MSKILLIDDDPGTLQGFSAILSFAGHAIATAVNGRQALDLIRQNWYDGVLTDLALPDMTGIDILASLRLAGDDTPVVVVTGFASAGTAVQAMKLGAVDFVEKPIDEQKLLEIVEALKLAMGEHSRRDRVGISENRAALGLELRDRRVHLALKAIRERFADPRLRVSTIAAELEISTEHLCRSIKKDTGVGFGHHLHRMRTQEAASLLVRSRLSVKEIAYKVGYATTNRLDHYFRRFLGHLPVEYRKARTSGNVRH